MLEKIVSKLEKAPASQLKLIDNAVDLILASNTQTPSKRKSYRKAQNGERLSDEKNRVKKSVKVTLVETVDVLLTTDAKNNKLEKGELVKAFIESPLDIPKTRKRFPGNIIRKKTALRLKPETIQLAEQYAKANNQTRGAWISAQIEARYLKNLNL